MRKILLTFSILFICLFMNAQISTFPYSQTFSNVDPANFTQDNSNWDFSDNSDWRSPNYSASIDDEDEYMYINLSVKSGHTYTLTFWSKNICRLKWNVNDTPDQNSLLQPLKNINISNNDCKNGIWKKDSITYTPFYDGIMYFQIRADKIEDEDDDEGYIDDILITETPPIALPITLLYLKAENIEYYNRIEWSTASETNNDYFLLEKTKDGLDFNTVCMVTGAGNSSYQRFYETNDVFITDGIVYYRLKQVDYDGKETKYDMISVDNRIKVAPTLKKITDVLGHEVAATETGRVLFFHYDDGTVIKRYFSEY
jgi:hypothetical protein